MVWAMSLVMISMTTFGNEINNSLGNMFNDDFGHYCENEF
jgi:hypothetical protein